MDRKKLLEEKRRRVEELRHRKANRTTFKTPHEPNLQAAEKAAALRSYVNGLLAAAPAPVAPVALPPTLAEPPPTPVKAPVEPALDKPKLTETYERGTQTAVAPVAQVDKKEPVQTVEVAPPIIEEEEEVVDESKLPDFMARTSRLVEKCLNESVVFDALREDFDELEDANESSKDAASELASFDSGKAVTQTLFSPFHGDLLLVASADRSSLFSEEYDGRVDLWSFARTVADRSLRCQSGVTCAAFGDDPHTVVAGTASGQVVVWDARSPSALPTHRTPLDARAPHKRSVQGIRVDADGLVSVSTDGVVASWSPNALDRPLETNDLDLRVSAFDVIDDGRVFLYGSDTGDLRRGDALLDPPHFGMVTSLAAHPSAKPSRRRLDDVTGLRRTLFLSTSIDWTARVWCEDQTVLTLDHGAHSYVADAKWSPARPSVFATVTSDGLLFFFKLLSSSAAGAPVASYKVSSAPLNCLDFADDGRRIAVADARGTTKLLAITDDACTRHDPRDDASFDDHIKHLRWGTSAANASSPARRSSISSPRAFFASPAASSPLVAGGPTPSS